MSFSEYNRRLLVNLHDSMALFMEGKLDLDEIQSVLQTISSILENDGTGVANFVRLAEADVEGIRFTRLLGEQRSAVIFRLDQLIELLSRGDVL
ncbi:hypothetical protein [Pseudofrankia sp. DC12]|uniref:hypothetical protein n=1 Tax=Pseudofrankia sp. DC12 TaxID=683315 RepID=UPI0005F7D101|nr:hypothetical protein [Pseudofrankia sp. DC12]